RRPRRRRLPRRHEHRLTDRQDRRTYPALYTPGRAIAALLLGWYALRRPASSVRGPACSSPSFTESMTRRASKPLRRKPWRLACPTVSHSPCTRLPAITNSAFVSGKASRWTPFVRL